MKSFKLNFFDRVTICLLPALVFGVATSVLGESSPAGHWTGALMWVTGALGYGAAQFWDIRSEVGADDMKASKAGCQILPFKKQ